MPIRKQGRYVETTPDKLNASLGKESDPPRILPQTQKWWFIFRDAGDVAIFVYGPPVLIGLALF